MLIRFQQGFAQETFLYLSEISVVDIPYSSLNFKMSFLICHSFLPKQACIVRRIRPASCIYLVIISPSCQELNKWVPVEGPFESLVYVFNRLVDNDKPVILMGGIETSLVCTAFIRLVHFISPQLIFP